MGKWTAVFAMDMEGFHGVSHCAGGGGGGDGLRDFLLI
jgi:hypothetical protein